MRLLVWDASFARRARPTHMRRTVHQVIILEYRQRAERIKYEKYNRLIKWGGAFGAVQIASFGGAFGAFTPSPTGPLPLLRT